MASKESKGQRAREGGKEEGKESKGGSLQSKPLPAPPKDFTARHAGPIKAAPLARTGGSAPSRAAMEAQGAKNARSFHGETVASLAHRHALRRQSRSARRTTLAEAEAAAEKADEEAAVAATTPRAAERKAPPASSSSTAASKRRGKKPGLSITISDSNAKTPREEDEEPPSSRSSGPSSGGSAAGAGMEPDFSRSYAVTQSGTIDVGGFNIGSQGLSRSTSAGAGGKTNIRRICVLGQGASGVVYKALHVPSLRLVAQKVIPVFETEKRHQMIRELETLYANIMPLEYGEAPPPDACPHIVGFYDAYSDVEEEGNISIIMEYLDGGSLQDIVDTGGCPVESILANISFRVLSGLAFIHERKQLHRDIKPSNILIDHNGACKISDFGTTRDLESTQAQANTFVGTLTYMSPERISGEGYSFASDMWSFGLSIMTCALGRFPMDVSGGYWSLVHSLRDEPSPELEEDDWSEEFRDFVHSCLSKEPGDRPTARDLLLHPFLEGCSDVVEAEEPMEDGSETARSELDEIADHLFAHYRSTWALPRFTMTQLQGLASQLGVTTQAVRSALEANLRPYLAERQRAVGAATAAAAAKE